MNKIDKAGYDFFKGSFTFTCMSTAAIISIANKIKFSWPEENQKITKTLKDAIGDLSIEYDETYKKSWDKCIERKNPILWNDAFKINYIDIRNKFFTPNRINYLSCDIEPPENTFNILTKIINECLEFDFISYEHDKYNSGDKYEVLSEKFLLSKNYKISIKDVYSRSKKHKIYETWFINKDIDFENISYDDWKKTKYKKNIFIK